MLVYLTASFCVTVHTGSIARTADSSLVVPNIVVADDQSLTVPRAMRQGGVQRRCSPEESSLPAFCCAEARVSYNSTHRSGSRLPGSHLCRGIHRVPSDKGFPSLAERMATTRRHIVASLLRSFAVLVDAGLLGISCSRLASWLTGTAARSERAALSVSTSGKSYTEYGARRTVPEGRPTHLALRARAFRPDEPTGPSRRDYAPRERFDVVDGSVIGRRVDTLSHSQGTVISVCPTPGNGSHPLHPDYEQR